MLAAAGELWGDRLTTDDLAAVLSVVVNMLDGLGRTVERALRLLAEMIVRHYPQTESR
jgi:hypothetical protein